MKTPLRLALVAGACLALGSLVSPSASAQDADDREPARVEIRSENGRVTINGKPVPEGTDVQTQLREMGIDGVTVHVDPDDAEDRTVVIVRDRDALHPFGVAGAHAWRDLAGKLDGLRSADFSVMMDADHGPGEVLNFFGVSPEVMRKERESRELAREAREAEGAERARLEQELESLLQEIFTQKEDERQSRIAEQRERLVKQEAEAAARMRDREEIIAQRKAELLGQQDRYDW